MDDDVDAPESYIEVELYEPEDDEEELGAAHDEKALSSTRELSSASPKKKTSTEKKTYSFEELSDLFGLPFHSAAVALGLHDTQLQRHCRKVRNHYDISKIMITFSIISLYKLGKYHEVAVSKDNGGYQSALTDHCY